jgi:hypothetical protein
MANTKEQTQEQSVQFRGRGRDNEYRVLVGEKEVGRVRRITKGDNEGKWFAVSANGQRVKGDPAPRNKAAQALIRS